MIALNQILEHGEMQTCRDVVRYGLKELGIELRAGDLPGDQEDGQAFLDRVELGESGPWERLPYGLHSAIREGDVILYETRPGLWHLAIVADLPNAKAISWSEVDGPHMIRYMRLERRGASVWRYAR